MRKATELTKTELEKVYENNSELRENVFKYGEESAYNYVEEYLEGCPNFCKYEFGYYIRNYFDLGCYLGSKDLFEFLDYCKQLIKDFEVNISKTDIEKAYSLNEKLYYYEDDLKAKDYQRIENRLNELTDNFCNAILELCSSEYEYFEDDNNLKEYFIELSDGFLTEDMYVDDDYILYENTTKCYT